MKPVFVAQSQFQNINEAIKDLRIREGISETKFSKTSDTSILVTTHLDLKMPEVANKVKQWAQEKRLHSCCMDRPFS